MDSSSSSERRRPKRANQALQPEKLQESTRKLLYRAQAGDSQALEAICARYLPRLARWATGRLPSCARSLVDTDDLIQESLVRTIHQLSGLQARRPESFPAYLRVAILNRVRDEARKTASRPEIIPLAGTEEDYSPSPLEEIIGQDLANRYEDALTRLKEDERSVIFLRVEMDLAYDEIADMLSKPSSGAARVAVYRALIHLAQEIAI